MPPGWELGPDAVLSVNSKSAVILNSRNMVTLDIDIADRQFNKWAMPSLEEVVATVLDLKSHDDHKYRSGWICGGTFPLERRELWLVPNRGRHSTDMHVKALPGD